MNEGIALTFACRTTSPFHTTRQLYSNLAKCAPFILGSTLRGAILARLIGRGICPHLSALDAPHDDAQLAAIHHDCTLHPFFPAPDESPRAWFSFGQFEAASVAQMYRAATRIALERESASVAEGAILTIESIAPNTDFAFAITLFGEAMPLADDVEWAVRCVAETEGIGRLRSIGYGQFTVEKVARESFAKRVADTQPQWKNASLSSPKFATPYVIGTGDGKVAALNRDEFTQTVQAQMSATLRAVGVDHAPVLNRAALMLTPEYVSRFSYQVGGPQHRLVAWQGSGLSLEFASNDENMHTALAIVSLLGLGEWSDCGFGQIRPGSG